MQQTHSPVMAKLSQRDRHRLLDRGVSRTLARNETLHFAGERADRIHLITQGVLKFVARDGSGNETILGIAVPGDIVGEFPEIDGMAQPLDVIAATETQVIGMDSATFMETVAATPDAARAFIEMQAGRLRWVYSTTLERSAGDVPARLAGRLLDLADIIGRVEDGVLALDLPLQQTELGRLAGICRESACKTMRSFKAEGFVDYNGPRLRILRPDVLERIRCAGRA